MHLSGDPNSPPRPPLQIIGIKHGCPMGGTLPMLAVVLPAYLVTMLLSRKALFADDVAVGVLERAGAWESTAVEEAGGRRASHLFPTMALEGEPGTSRVSPPAASPGTKLDARATPLFGNDAARLCIVVRATWPAHPTLAIHRRRPPIWGQTCQHRGCGAGCRHQCTTWHRGPEDAIATINRAGNCK